MQIKKLATILGATLIVLGILGFVPGITSDGMLLGVFEVSAIQSFVYLLSGVAALLVSSSEENAQGYFMIFGCIYALVALVGFVQGDTVFGIIDINMADNLLHGLLAVVLLSIGFGAPKSSAAQTKQV